MNILCNLHHYMENSRNSQIHQPDNTQSQMAQPFFLCDWTDTRQYSHFFQTLIAMDAKRNKYENTQTLC